MGWSQGEASALLPFTRVEFGVTEGGMGALLAFARLAAFGAILVGALADRIGRRRPLIVSVAMLVLSAFLSALATSPLQYVLAQSLARIGGAATAALAVVVMAESVTPGVRAYAISFFGASASLGAGFSVMTLPLVEQTAFGWRLPHALPAVLLIIVPILWNRLPESPLIDASDATMPHFGALLHSTHRSRFLLVSVAGLLASAYSAVALAFTTERLIGDLGLSAGSAAVISLGGGTLGAAGFFVGGWLSDGWGRRNTSILALALALGGGITLYSVTEAWMLVGAAAVSAFGSFAFIPAGGAHRAELFPTRLRGYAGTAAGYLATVGSALGLLVASVTIDRFGLAPTIVLLGAGVVFAMVATAALPETLGTDLADPVGDLTP